MKQGVKRPIRAYLFHGLWLAVTLYLSIASPSIFGHWTLRTVILIGLVSFIEKIVRRNYLEVANNKLVIYDSFFRTKTIDLDKIEKLDISPSPFSSSKIVLKDKTIITYADSETDDKELRKVMEQFHIPVE